MQCKCGGDTRITDSVNKKLLASLEFYECKSCGRVSSAQLFVDGTLVAEDPLARQHYANLDKDLAKELLASPRLPERKPAPEPIRVIAQPSRPLTVPLDRQNIEAFETGSLF